MISKKQAEDYFDLFKEDAAEYLKRKDGQPLPVMLLIVLQEALEQKCPTIVSYVAVAHIIESYGKVIPEILQSKLKKTLELLHAKAVIEAEQYYVETNSLLAEVKESLN